MSYVIRNAIASFDSASYRPTYANTDIFSWLIIEALYGTWVNMKQVVTSEN